MPPLPVLGDNAFGNPSTLMLSQQQQMPFPSQMAQYPAAPQQVGFANGNVNPQQQAEALWNGGSSVQQRTVNGVAKDSGSIWGSAVLPSSNASSGQ